MTAFKVGDRVRLTGDYWTSDKKGKEFCISGVTHNGTPYVRVQNDRWYISGNGYEAELVTHAEEEEDAGVWVCWRFGNSGENVRVRVFADELEALRHANESDLIDGVTFWAFGEEL